jgi:hypothetical protein
MGFSNQNAGGNISQLNWDANLTVPSGYKIMIATGGTLDVASYTCLSTTLVGVIQSEGGL